MRHVHSRPVPASRSLSGALARQGWVLVAATAAGAVSFWTASALMPKVYESRVVVALDPVSLDHRFGAADAPVDAAQAIVRERHLVESEAVESRASAQMDFDPRFEVEAVSDDSLELRARSTSGPQAEVAVQTLANTYLTVRQEIATGLANNAIDVTQSRIDDLNARRVTGTDVTALLGEQEDLLADFEAGRAAVGDTARVALGPSPADGAVSPRPLQAAVAGLMVGLVLGLLIAAAREDLRASVRPERLWASLPKVEIKRRDGGALRFAWAARPRPARAVLTALVLGRAAVYVVLGVNFVFDDWSLEYWRSAAGTWQSVPSGQDLVHARPGAWLTFTLLHGVVGPHPLLQFLVLTAINLAVVLVLYGVLARFFERPLALAITATWVLLPIHQSMVVWSGTSQIAVGALLFLLGTWALTDGRWMLAGVGLAASILCYELVVPVALVAIAIVGTPLAPVRADDGATPRTLSLRARAGALSFVIAATAWSRAHPVYPMEWRLPSPRLLWSGHFGIGLFGSLSTPERLVAIVGASIAGGVVVCLLWWLRGDRARSAGPSLVVAGLCVFVLGLVVALTTTTGVLGFNDRLYAVSSVGAAMMLVGIGTFLWRRAPVLTVALALAMVAAVAVGQFVSLRSWSHAGADVVALMDYLERTYPDPAHTNFVVGPEQKIRNNVIGASSPFGGADAAFRVAFPEAGPPCGLVEDRRVVPVDTCQGSLVIVDSPEDFVQSPWGESLVDWSQVLGADGTP